MHKILYYDYAAFAIFAIIAVSIMVKGLTRGKLNRQFFMVLIVALFATVFDIGAITFDNLEDRNAVVQYLFHTGYLFFHSLSTPLYVTYIVNLVDGIHIFKHKGRHILMQLPFMVLVVCLMINVFVPCIFSIGPDGEYKREAWMNYLYLMAVFYILVGIIVVIRYRKRLSKRIFTSVIAVFPMVVAAALYQLQNPNVPVEMFANAIGLLFVVLFIQSPEQIVSGTTGLNKITRYMSDIQNAMDNGEHITIIIISLENDKTLREMMGVAEYHKLLKLLANRFLMWGSRWKSSVEWYYLGNGMFRCVFNGKYADQAEEFASFVNNEMKKGYEYNDMLINTLANICVLYCPDDIDDVDTVMRFGVEITERKYVGEVLYAKDIYKKDRYDIIRSMDVIIDRAFAEGNFEVFYQPIYSVKENQYNSAEALLRLHDDEYGFVSPEIFIPAAEQNGMIHKIGTFVLEEVCKFIASKEFKETGLEYIEVNLSVMQCMSSELVGEVQEIINKYGISPKQVNLEITETAAAYAQTTMMDNINKLTKNGIAFSLDDFGTGYSNMKRIASMPFAIVKLDKTFAEMNSDDKLRRVVKDTIYMVKDMNMRIVVEGVETEESFAEFKALGVDYIQGYYFSKPLPGGKFVKEVSRVNLN